MRQEVSAVIVIGPQNLDLEHRWRGGELISVANRIKWETDRMKSRSIDWSETPFPHVAAAFSRVENLIAITPAERKSPSPPLSFSHRRTVKKTLIEKLPVRMQR